MIPVLHGVWAAAGGLVGDFEHIETQTVGAGGVSSLTFSSIPGTYKHLQIRATVRGSANFSPDNMNFQFNGDTGANYAGHQLYGNGSSAASGGGSNNSLITCARLVGNSATASIFSGVVIDILDYASTSKFKTTRSLDGYDTNGAGEIYLHSGLWRSTSAITSIKFDANPSWGFAQHSTFSLYGVK